jgi:predicted short-subunit dehydrogenase-like oxidoreductase (DUF2520 family)
MDEIASYPYSAGFFDLVGGDPENWPAIYRARGNQASPGTLAGFVLRRRFSHGNNIEHRFESGRHVGSGRVVGSWGASVMLPGMRASPNITIVGAGNLAHALAVSLRHAGYKIEGVLARSGGTSLRKAQKLAKETGARAAVIPAETQAPVVWFCVPDAEIAHAAQALAQEIDWKRKVALHSSGALTSDELGALRQRGAAIASVHPLMTFVRDSRPSLEGGVPFAIEGDGAAVKVARRIVNDLAGRAYPIRKTDKAAYHAWATFGSPLFTALLATTEQVAALAGVKPKEARRRMIPILRQTLANYAAFGAAGAFSGPIVRGDVRTVQSHIRTLRATPVALDVYLSLANAAVAYLPVKNKETLMSELKSARRKRRRD